jgi:hypothetical protein
MKCYSVSQDAAEESQVVSTSSAVHDPGGMTNLNVDPGAMGIDLTLS